MGAGKPGARWSRGRRRRIMAANDHGTRAPTSDVGARQERGATAQRERASAASNAGRGERKWSAATQPLVHARWWVGQQRRSAKTRQRPDSQRASRVRIAKARSPSQLPAAKNVALPQHVRLSSRLIKMNPGATSSEVSGDNRPK
jgi:hypothetical protein